MNHSDEILSILREEIEQYDNRTRCDETGTVIEVGDGIATVYGLNRAVYGELVQFDTGVHGIVLDLKRDSVGVVLLGSEDGLHEGSAVSRTRRSAARSTLSANRLTALDRLKRPSAVRSSERLRVWYRVSR